MSKQAENHIWQFYFFNKKSLKYVSFISEMKCISQPEGPLSFPKHTHACSKMGLWHIYRCSLCSQPAVTDEASRQTLVCRCNDWNASHSSLRDKGRHGGKRERVRMKQGHFRLLEREDEWKVAKKKKMKQRPWVGVTNVRPQLWSQMFFSVTGANSLIKPTALLHLNTLYFFWVWN